ncbi:MAG TPA: AAA family ATPase [Candidatus Sulfotelmatobacter sp.]
MRLKSVHVREFKSVWNSNEFQVGDVTCLVGKNEAGKTAILQALYRLNPIIDADAKFDVTLDYPKLDVEDYEQDVEAGRRNRQTSVISAKFTLTDEEMQLAKDDFGEDIFASTDIVVSRGYTDTFYVTVSTDDAACVRTWVESAGLPDDVKADALKQPNFKALLTHTQSGLRAASEGSQDRSCSSGANCRGN